MPPFYFSSMFNAVPLYLGKRSTTLSVRKRTFPFVNLLFDGIYHGLASGLGSFKHCKPLTPTV